jgi:hypothetical protein
MDHGMFEKRRKNPPAPEQVLTSRNAVETE